ncbi:MAG: hypothetical protein CL804_11695 [Citromicrobium sp.]|nr:hypothetical protein [Citromicrobium sp.]
MLIGAAGELGVKIVERRE